MFLKTLRATRRRPCQDHARGAEGDRSRADPSRFNQALRRPWYRGTDDIDPETASFRLVEVTLDDLEDVKWLPGPKPWGTHFVEALSAGATLQPIVIVPTARTDGKFGLLDGRVARMLTGRSDEPRFALTNCSTSDGRGRPLPCASVPE